MKIKELVESHRSVDELIQAYKDQYRDEIKASCVRDQCGFAATGFEQFAADNGFGMVERVQGYFEADRSDPGNLKPGEDFNDPKVREKSRIIPHQWNEYQGKIIDFTGKAQFVDTGLATDTDESRYSY